MRRSIVALGVVAIAASGAVLWAALEYAHDDAGGVVLMPRDERLVAVGAAVYADNCAACHGSNLEGAPNWRTRGPDGRLPAPPHNETGHTWHHDDGMLFALTKYGPRAVAGPDYRSDMPAYDAILEDREIVAVLSFIKSRWPREIRARHDRINDAARRDG